MVNMSKSRILPCENAQNIMGILLIYDSKKSPFVIFVQDSSVNCTYKEQRCTAPFV